MAELSCGAQRVDTQKHIGVSGGIMSFFLDKVSLCSPDDMDRASSWDYRYSVLLK